MTAQRPSRVRSYLSLMLLLWAPLLGRTQELVKGTRLEGWNYSTASRPLSERYADPGGRLNDGEHGRDRTVIYRGGTVSLTLDLAGPARLQTVRIHQHRHNLNYRLTHLAVMCRIGGHWQERARMSDGFVGPTPSMDFVHTLALDGVVTDAIRLDFVGANVLSVSEVELYGEPLSGVKSSLTPFADLPYRPLDTPTAREQDLDGDGTPEVILENRAVRLIFTPARGGVCQSLRLKASDTEWVGTASADFGLFRDQLWHPDYSFADRVYFHRTRVTDDEAAVELWTTGSGGMMSFTEIRKTISLRRGTAVIGVEYALTNQPSSQTPYEYGMWFHNWVGDASSPYNTYTFPTTDGVQEVTLEPGKDSKGGEHWYRDPARGWTTVRNAAGNGLAFTLPYKYLNLYYTWYGAASRTATHEWRFNRLPCAPGEALRAAMQIIPFADFPRIDGAAAGVVGAIEYQGSTVTAGLQVPSLNPPDRARLRLLSLERAALGDEVTTELEPGKRARIVLSTRQTPPFIAVVDILKDGEIVGQLERCVADDTAGIAYRLPPEGPQEGTGETTDSRIEEYALKTDVVTPHIPWAKPLAQGPIRALVLMDDMNCREAVELAQRVDLTLDYVKFRTTHAKELLWQGDRSIETLDQAQERLEERLRTRGYDVMIVAGFDWGFHFTDAIHRLVERRVREGMGLVLIQPDGFSLADVETFPVAGVARQGDDARPMHAWHRWHADGGHPLTAGLDWQRFPRTRRHEYDVAPAGDVVATAGDDHAPLLTVGTLGEGRLVSATWDTLTHAMSYRGYSALTPILSYRGGWLRPEFAELPDGYHEWWYALLARAALWASGRESPVQVVEATPVSGTMDSPPRVIVALHAAAAVPEARADLYWQDSSGRQTSMPAERCSLHEGTQQHAFLPPENALTAGENVLCFIVRDQAGTALAWGFTTITLHTPARLETVALEPAILLPRGGVWQADSPVETAAFEPEGTITIRASLHEATPEALDAEIVLRDTAGRLLAVIRQPVPQGAREFSASWKPELLVRQGIQADLTLRHEDRVIDRGSARAVAYRPRVWDRFWFTSWGGQYLWRSHYLFDFNNRLVRDFGIDVSFWGQSELNTGKVRDNAFWGINHSWLGLLSYMGRGVPNFMDNDFSRKASAYAKTGDKAHLVRTPSLVDPDWRNAVRTSLVEKATLTLDAGGTYDYCMGDEMSLTHYTTFHDYDWSEHSLQDFQRWLKTRYADLHALNASWDSDFTSWDGVLPLTRLEARQRDNPAAWCEFRLYMNHQLADFYRFVQSTLRSVDPHAQCGLSGTQSPEAGNGMDWWLLSDAFSYYHSYNTSWSNEMRRSFKRAGRPAEQSPYFSGYNATDPQCERRMWWCLFHDTRGISCWKTSLFFHGDFTSTPSGQDTKRHLDAFRSGIWRLLRGARRQHDGIAIHYSMPTIIAAALTGEGQAVNAYRDAWVKLLEDNGLQYEFLASDQIRAGDLDPAEFKLLILPYSLALARDEADAIGRFVDKGGHVIATRQPGRRDGLGRPQSPALLDHLFGVRTEGSQRAVEPGIVTREPLGPLPAGTTLRMPPAMTSLQLDSARALATADQGRVPVLLQSPNGRATILNVDLMHVEQERRFHSAAEGVLKAMVQSQLDAAGIRRPYPITLDSGYPAHVETVVYDAPEVRFVCLLNWDDRADVAAIALPSQRDVYDVRAGRHMGRTDTIRIPLDPGAARVFALCSSALTPPTVTAQSPVQQGQTLEVTVDQQAGEGRLPRRLLRIDVTDASGAARSDYRQTVWIEDGPVECLIPVALSDPTGTWQITAHDVISGETASAKVVVVPAPE